MESYRDFAEVFEIAGLPKQDGQFASYQLLRNVLAAYQAGRCFCVMLDRRRPDLLEAWYAVMRWVRITELRLCCKVLTWQELAEALPRKLQEFLEEKYGIVPACLSTTEIERQGSVATW
jgi:hypothetical protein